MKKEPYGYRNVYVKDNGANQFLGTFHFSRENCERYNSDARAWGVKLGAGMHRRIGVLRIYMKER